MSFNHVYNRKVSDLQQNSPINSTFTSGGKDLIPVVYCHGNKSNGEEAYGTCMMLASRGYLVISINFMD